MALATRSSDASIETTSAGRSNPIPNFPDIVAGEALDAVAPCYIKSSDNKVYMSNGTSDNEAAEVIGMTGKSYVSGEPVTLYPPGTVFYYGDDLNGDDSIDPGDFLYVGATKGRLDTTATTGDAEGVAQALDNNHIIFLRRKDASSSHDELAGTTPGTVTASKAVVVDANKDIGDFRNLDAVNVDAGASGTAGSVDVFPSTAAKGKLAITAVDNAGDTTTTIANAEQAGARTYSIQDAGASASFLMGASGAFHVRAGVAAVTGTADVVTGLATVVAVIVAAQDDLDGDTLSGVSATIGDQAGTPAAGSITINAWKSNGDGDATNVAATAEKDVNWIAIGT